MEKKLSVVVSVYNEEQALPMFYETIKLILEILPGIMSSCLSTMAAGTTASRF